MGLNFGEALVELFVLYLERHFPNNPLLLRVDCEPCRSSDIVLSESYNKKKFINKSYAVNNVINIY